MQGGEIDVPETDPSEAPAPRPTIAGAALDRLIDPALDPLFADAPRSGVPSAWYGHVPFAFWIMRALRPQVFVELGTHNGVSYAALCEAALREPLGAKGYAVDTWQGDEHAGFYHDDVLRNLSAFHDVRYGAFSRLLQSTFDDACGHFAPGSIDLLHIDGLHTYEAVRHDFETWRPKLSDRAVVLFHDVNVRERGFGVWRLWTELRDQFPAFDFVHSHGLGVLAVGPALDGPVRALCALTDPAEIAIVRARFSQAGLRCAALSDLALGRGDIDRAIAERDQVDGERHRIEAELKGEIATAVEALALGRQENEGLVARVLAGEGRALRNEQAANAAERRHEIAALRHVAAEERIAQLEQEAAARDRDIVALRAGLAAGQAIADSTIWRATAPVRRVLAAATPWRRAR